MALDTVQKFVRLQEPLQRLPRQIQSVHQNGAEVVGLSDQLDQIEAVV